MSQLYIPRKSAVLASGGLIAPEWDRSFLQPLVQAVDGLTAGTGSAATWTTPRLLAGNSVDGSANVAFANKVIVQGTVDAGLSAAQFLGALATGIVKNTVTTGVLSIAVAGDFPTLNQNTSGTAAGLSAVLAAASGGTGVNNAGTLTNATATTITGGGTVALGGFTLTVPATGTDALLNQANSFTLINPLTTIAESWIGPSSTTGVYFKGGFVGIGAAPTEFFHVRKDQSGAATNIRVENHTTAIAAFASVQAVNDAGNIASFGIYSTTTTAYGAITALSGFMYAGTSGGLCLMADNAAATIRFASGGNTEVARFNALGSLVLKFPATLKNYTVATLPAGVQGYVAYCTDLLAPTFMANAVGGGAIVGVVFYNGANWVSF